MNSSDSRITFATTIEDVQFALALRRSEFEGLVMASPEIEDRAKEGELRNRVCLAVIDLYPELDQVIFRTPPPARLGLLCALELGSFNDFSAKGLDAIQRIAQGEITVPVGILALLNQANDAIAASR